MHISWHGHYTVKIQVGEKVLILDPYSPKTGLAPWRATADIVALSNPSDPTMSYRDGIKGEYVLIDTPGEFEVSGFGVYALGWYTPEGHLRSVQRWNIDGMTILHVGALNRPLTATELQELEKTGIDILLVPIGGGGSLTGEEAGKLITTIEPRVVIPIHYALPSLNEKLESMASFAKQMGIPVTTVEKKLVLKANKLPQDETVTMLLGPA